MWLAMYNRGFESWTYWRKYDSPLLVAPPDALSELPVRLSYPIVEQTLNRVNYQEASSAINLTSVSPFGDELRTKLFWDLY